MCFGDKHTHINRSAKAKYALLLSAGVSTVQPKGQNRPDRESNLACRMCLPGVKISQKTEEA